MILRFFIAGLLLTGALAFRSSPLPSLRARTVLRGSNAEEEVNVGRTFRVIGVQYKEGAHANLKVTTSSWCDKYLL
jgi:hypothetical protein